MASNTLDGYEWSVTPRGIPATGADGSRYMGIPDIYMYNDLHEEVWVPVEFNPEDYISSGSNE